MFAAAIFLASAGWCAAPPPIIVSEEPANSVRERYRQMELELIRTEIHFAPKFIEIDRLALAVAETRGRTVQVEQLRKQIAATQARLKRLQEAERRLWQQQPGGITAPPPRGKVSPPE